jgi:hypothetical protein
MTGVAVEIGSINESIVWESGEVRQRERGVTQQGITIEGLGNDAELCFK